MCECVSVCVHVCLFEFALLTRHIPHTSKTSMAPALDECDACAVANPSLHVPTKQPPVHKRPLKRIWEKEKEKERIERISVHVCVRVDQ